MEKISLFLVFIETEGKNKKTDGDPDARRVHGLGEENWENPRVRNKRVKNGFLTTGPRRGTTIIGERSACLARR